MKLRHFFAVAASMLAACALPLSGARADMLYDASTLVQGQQAFTESFNVTSPGTLTMSISNIPWLDTVSDLSFFLTTSSGGMVGSMMGGSGSESVNVGTGTIYAHWFGDAKGDYDIGVLGVNIQFQPGVLPVPLPPTLVLMLSGLALLFGWQRKLLPGMASR
jgi:hypothetical protein